AVGRYLNEPADRGLAERAEQFHGQSVELRVADPQGPQQQVEDQFGLRTIRQRRHRGASPPAQASFLSGSWSRRRSTGNSPRGSSSRTLASIFSAARYRLCAYSARLRLKPPWLSVEPPGSASLSWACATSSQPLTTCPASNFSSGVGAGPS